MAKKVNGEQKKRVTFWVSPSLHKTLRIFAAKDATTVSEINRRLLENFVKFHQD